MPKHLQQVSYTTQGLKGLVKDGGSKRRAVIAEAAKSVGGRLEACYFAFGESDPCVILDVPHNTSAAAVALAANASGVAQDNSFAYPGRD